METRRSLIVAGVVLGLIASGCAGNRSAGSSGSPSGPSQPVATATTSAGGEFTVTGLAPGRYFLTTIGRAAFTIGFAVVGPSPGASVVLVGCTDCPLPSSSGRVDGATDRSGRPEMGRPLRGPSNEVR